LGGGSATLCCTGSGIAPAGGGGSLMWTGDGVMGRLAQALSKTLQTTGMRGELGFFIAVRFVVLLQL
jgi:hypothetical protein